MCTGIMISRYAMIRDFMASIALKEAQNKDARRNERRESRTGEEDDGLTKKVRREKKEGMRNSEGWGIGWDEEQWKMMNNED